MRSSIIDLAPRQALCVNPEDYMSDIIKGLQKDNAGAAVVVSPAHQALGILTERDIVCRLAGKQIDFLTARAFEYMTPEPVCLRETSSVARLLYEMAVGGFRHIPILDAHNQVRKLVVVKDVIDLIYRAFTKKLTGETPPDICLESEVDQFLIESVDILKPTKPRIVQQDWEMLKVIEKLAENNLGAVAVLSSRGKLQGIFTERDYLKKIALKEPPSEHLPVSQFMTKNPHSLLESASVSLAFNAMSEGGFRHIPVVNYSEELIGMLSVRSFLDFLSSAIIHELESGPDK